MCYIEDKDSPWVSTFIGLAIGVTISQYILSQGIQSLNWKTYCLTIDILEEKEMSIKEKFENAKTKVANWCDEHRKVIGNIMIGSGILGTAALVAYIANKNSIDSLDIPIPVEEGNSQYALPDWNESYRENWDKVNEFVNTLTLEPGEMFVIEDGREYDRDVIVSHLVYGDGVYPPEEK